MPGVANVQVERVTLSGLKAETDFVAIEEPLEIRLGQPSEGKHQTRTTRRGF
jgi:hypothetical protein